MRSKKELEVTLSRLGKVKKQDAKLEQYETPSDIAAEVLWSAFMNGDIKNKIIADLGCGNGVIGIGCLLLGAKKVFFLDSDSESILVTKKNLSDLELENHILLHQDIGSFNEKIDTVIQNPPFGVQNEHADRNFLIKAMEHSRKIYSFHKSESESFIKSLATEYNFKIANIMKFRFPLKKTQEFHTKKAHGVDVSCFILSKA